MSEAAKSKIGTDLTEGSIPKTLLKYVSPLLAANVIQQLYNTVDVMVIGKYAGSTGTVAVSNGGELAGLITFIGLSFGSAVQIYISQLFGAKRYRSIREAIITALLFTTGLASALMLMCIAGCSFFLAWLNCPAEAFVPARQYMIIVSIGLPFIFGYNVICGILRGIGEVQRPLLFILIAAVCNIFLDILLVAVFPWGAAGTAIATVIAQLASFLAAFVFLYRRREHFELSFSPKHLRIHASHLRVILQLGIPMSAQAIFIHFTQLICTSSINTYGLTASAVNSIGNKIQKFITVFITSITNGSGAVIGQNIGARRLDRARSVLYTTLFYAAIVSAAACLISIFLPRQAFALFTNDTQVIELGIDYMRICLIIFICSPLQGSYHAIITGVGNAKLNFISGVFDGIVLRLGISYWFAYGLGMGVTGFFYGNALARLAPTLISMVYFYSRRWEHYRLIQN